MMKSAILFNPLIQGLTVGVVCRELTNPALNILIKILTPLRPTQLASLQIPLSFPLLPFLHKIPSPQPTHPLLVILINPLYFFPSLEELDSIQGPLSSTMPSSSTSQARIIPTPRVVAIFVAQSPSKMANTCTSLPRKSLDSVDVLKSLHNQSVSNAKNNNKKNGKKSFSSSCS